MIVDLAYGMVVEHMTYEQREEVNKTLDDLDGGVADDGSRTVLEKEMPDGRVVRISEARLARIRNNMAAMGNIGKG